MKVCEKCHVSVRGNRNTCPLCQNELHGLGGEEADAFPKIPTIYKQYHFFFRLLIFLSILGGVVSVAVNIMVPQGGWWSLFVLMGIGCLWISLVFAVRKRHNIPKNLLYQVVILSGLSVLWDLVTNWSGWSLDYAIPILCITALLSLSVVLKVTHMRVGDIITYVTIAAIFGIVPIVFYLTGCLRVLYPSIICVAVSLITLAALLVFRGEEMRSELKRRLHV